MAKGQPSRGQCAHAWGLVDWKISSMQAQVTSHTSGLNFSPFRITRFSRQFVPDRASCSLSRPTTQSWWDAFPSTPGWHQSLSTWTLCSSLSPLLTVDHIRQQFLWVCHPQLPYQHSKNHMNSHILYFRVFLHCTTHRTFSTLKKVLVFHWG